MIVCVTGHRPDKLPDRQTGYNPNNPVRRAVRSDLIKQLVDLRPERTITGMALGVDQDFAEVCVSMQIPFIAAVPFHGQAFAWPPPAIRHYRELLEKAAEVELVCSPGYAPWKMQKRNEWMVDRAEVVLAVWNGSSGGTANCVTYAKKVGKRIRYINPALLG